MIFYQIFHKVSALSSCLAPLSGLHQEPQAKSGEGPGIPEVASLCEYFSSLILPRPSDDLHLKMPPVANEIVLRSFFVCGLPGTEISCPMAFEGRSAVTPKNTAPT